MKRIKKIRVVFLACALTWAAWLTDDATAVAQCNLSFSVGADTMINCGTPLTIQATPGMGSYHWNTGSTDPFIIVSQPGLYWCIGSDTLGNAVVNGDFSQGQTGFMSDYVPGAGGSFGILSLEGTYAVTPNSNFVHTNFVNCYDHTQGNASGSMMVVNGASVPNQIIWRQIVNVQPNTNYIFSVWAMSAVSSNPGQLMFSVNGTQIGNILTLPVNTCQWQSFYINWNSGANTTADLGIINQNSSVSGNDFAIDDILFAPVCLYGDSIVVTNPSPPVLTVSPNDTICPGGTSVLTASASISGSTISWNPGSLSGTSVSVSPVTTTQYNVVATSPQGCASSPQTVIVAVLPAPQVSIGGNDSICLGEQVSLTATSGTAGASFVWQPGNISGPSITVTPGGPTVYSAIATSPAGCVSQADSFAVFTKPVPVVTVQDQFTICAGDTATITASYPSGSSLLWSPGGETTVSIDVFPSSGTLYTVVATAAGCSSEPDTAEVIVNPVPVVTVPDDQVICPGEELLVQVTSDVPGATFTWQPGNLTGSQQTFSPDTFTTYYVQAAADGCFSEVDSFTVDISNNCDCAVIVPDAFSPGEDMINDFYHTMQSSGCNITEFDFAIYSRWGNKVWQATEITEQWDGKTNGTFCADGTYFWTMRYTHEGANATVKHSDSGVLNIFR